MTDAATRRYTDLLVFIAICAVGWQLYSGTLDVPWLFDDIQNICENPVVHDLGSSLRAIWAPRGLAYVTFALNYRFGELDVAGYHIVNIVIHLLASLIAYLLAKRAFDPSSEPPADRDEHRATGYNLPAVSVGLLFLVHPLQTQAVNYIVQRMTSLAALLFLLALYGYVRYRECGFTVRHSRFTIHGIHWYLCSLVAAVLALMTKQNTAVLPAALFLFDWLITNRGDFSGIRGRRLLALVPFIVVSLIFIYVQVGVGDVLLNDAQRAEYWARADEASATAAGGGAATSPLGRGELPKISKMTKPPENLQMIYLVTEFKVLWLYLRLLFLPYDQTFDYGYPLETKMGTLQNIAAGAGLLALFLLACALVRRRPLVSFGIFWFFTALAVESSIIPLDAAVEHRLYLPLFGFAVTLVSLATTLPIRRYAPALLAVVLILYGGAAWQRNALWGDDIAFARDGVKKAPHNQRTYLTLATAYAGEGRWAEAEATLRRAIPLRPSHHIPYDNLGTALFQQGKVEEARAYFNYASLLMPNYGNALFNYGIASLRLGDMPAAMRALDRLRALRSPLAYRLGSEFTRNP